MKHGRVVNIKDLQIGDVVRLVHGQIGDVQDFRQGYDAMTVVYIEGDRLDFHRPHIEIYDTSESRINHVETAVEIVSHCSRSHTGLNYELLNRA